MKRKNIILLCCATVFLGVGIFHSASSKDFRNITPEEAVENYRDFIKQNKTHQLSLLRSTLYKQLEHEDCVVRMNVAEVIGELDDQGIIEDLWRITRNDKTSIVREAAVEGMCLSGDKSSVKYLLKLLRDKDVLIRRKAAECFDRLGDKTMLEDLRRAFNDENDELNRIMIAMSMAHFGDEGKKEFILRILTDHVNPAYRIYVAESLFDHPIAINKKILETTFEYEKDRIIRVKVASLLAIMGDDKKVDILKTILSQNSDVELRIAAAWSLIEQNDPKYLEYAYPFILELLNETDWRVRELVIEMLDDYHDFPLTPLLGEILAKDEHPVVREIAAWLMGERKKENALTYLEKGLYDENADVRTGVLAAIYKILKANTYEK